MGNINRSNNKTISSEFFSQSLERVSPRDQRLSNSTLDTSRAFEIFIMEGEITFANS